MPAFQRLQQRQPGTGWGRRIVDTIADRVSQGDGERPNWQELGDRFLENFQPGGVPDGNNPDLMTDNMWRGPTPGSTPGPALEHEGGLLPWGTRTFLEGLQDLWNMIPGPKDEYERRTGPLTEEYQRDMDELLNIIRNTYGDAGGSFDEAMRSFEDARGAVADPVMTLNFGAGNQNVATPVYNNRLARTYTDIGTGQTGVGTGRTNLATSQGATEGGLLAQTYQDVMRQIGGGVDLSREQLENFWKWYDEVGDMILKPWLEMFWQVMTDPSGSSTYGHTGGGDSGGGGFGIGLPGVGSIGVQW